jgi:hypothetical protein
VLFDPCIGEGELLLPEAGAQQTLEAVSSTPLLGRVASVAFCHV